MLGGREHLNARKRTSAFALATALGVFASSAFAACALPDVDEYSRGGTPDGGEDDATAPRGDASNGDASTSSETGTPSTGDGGATIVACGDNGIPGERSTLYRSQGGNVTTVDVCSRGCEWTKNAVNDKCRTSSNCVAGSGLYCGGNGVSGDSDVLFRCGGGKIVPEQRCANGCERESAGVDDRCK
jgi:hypothetical protein